jgi:hypothetical protein
MTKTPDPEWRKKAIKRRLREIRRNPTVDGAAEEIARLTGELRRLVSAERAPEPTTPVAPVTGLTADEAAAVETWPSELRARLDEASLTRVILPWGRD